MFSGCSEEPNTHSSIIKGIDDTVFGGARRRRKRTEELHEMRMKLLNQAIETGDTQTASEIFAEIEEEKIREKRSEELKAMDRQQRKIIRQNEEIQRQLDEMEHNARFDRMQRGGLP